MPVDVRVYSKNNKNKMKYELLCDEVIFSDYHIILSYDISLTWLLRLDLGR